MTMTLTRYYIGTTTHKGDKVDKAQIAECVRHVATAYDGGCTAYRALGYWQGAVEGSVVVEVLHGDTVQDDKPAPDPDDVGAYLAATAEQSSVMWTRQTVEAGFTG